MARESAEDFLRAVVYKLLTAPAISLKKPYPSGAPTNVKVFDEVPTGALFPYISLGASEEYPDDTHSGPGALVRLSVHTWSEYTGFAELSALNRAIKTRLADVYAAPAGSPTGWKDITIKIIAARSMRDENPRLRHGITDVQLTANQED